MNREDDTAEFELLLEYLRRSRGFDFTGYKRTSLVRRVNKRLHAVGATTYSGYTDYLEVHPEEFGRLFDTILINVTAYFRDPSAWEAVSSQVVPRILAGKRPGDPIRIWTAGCASGEEAYSLAMSMAEALGIDPFRDRVKIYATDVDEEALTRARHAAYTAREVATVPAELLAKYFEENNGRYTFHKDLRRSVIFGRHDLIQDAPISRIDLLSCRNTLMYLNTETQARILERFHFALHERGFLFLGKAETLLTYNSTFVPVDLKRRIFAKVARGNLRDRLLVMARTGSEEAVNHLVGHVRIRESAFDTSPVAQIVVDFGGTLTLANDRARTVFNIAPTDLARPLQDVQISYRPAELRSCIDRAYAERGAIVLKDVEWSAGIGDPSYFEVHVVPLMDAGGSLLGASITFLDTTAAKRIADEHQRSTRELETAYEELQSTNEELETTNEELQSTVEELETTSEELQSTNEELETVNVELRQRSEELKRVNTFLESILGSLRGGVVVVDADFLILVWNQKAENLWGLRGDEVRGRNLLNLDIGLPVVRLKPALRSCLSGEVSYREISLEATDRRGKAILCRVTSTPLSEGGAISGVIVVMEDGAEAAARDRDDLAARQRAGTAGGHDPADGDGEPRRQPHAPPPSLAAPDGEESVDEESRRDADHDRGRPDDPSGPDGSVARPA
jgi:two-component system CheB/CheR fusion protein